MSSVEELYSYFKNLYNVYKNAISKYGYELEKVMNELSTYVLDDIENLIASVPEIQNFFENYEINSLENLNHAFTDYDKKDKFLIKYIILVRFIEAIYFSEFELEEAARKQLEEMIKYLESIEDVI